ncbi:MAG: hypothetical protein AAGA48_28555 [Myxococcota bacterium]
MTRTLCFALVAGLAGCGWNNLPDGRSNVLDEPLWAPNEAVATSSGLYVRLPWSGRLIRIAPNGEVEPIDLGQGRVSRIAAAPDEQTIVAFVDEYFCAPDDRQELRRVTSITRCQDADLTVESTIRLVRGTAAAGTQPVNGAYDAVEFSADGRFGIAHIEDFNNVTINGVVNLNGVAVLDLERDGSEIVTVGFAPDQVLFNYDDAGLATSAVVLSRNRVASIGLGSQPYAITQFPLTLDPDVVRDPNGIDLTPDGRYALISTANEADLYVIDLMDESINIIDLSGEPATLQVADDADRTVLVYDDSPVVEVMEHGFFTVDRLDLDEPMNQITTTGGLALLWGDDDQHDLYALDLATQQLTEYSIQNPAISLHPAPGGEFAIAMTRPESGVTSGSVDALYDANPGMEVLDLAREESVPFLLEGRGIGVAFVADETSLNALILQEGIDYLQSYDLLTGALAQIDLSAPPVTIGSLPDASLFWITHNNALGLVSFFNPQSGELIEVSGFAATGLLDPIQFAEAPEVQR